MNLCGCNPGQTIRATEKNYFVKLILPLLDFKSAITVEEQFPIKSHSNLESSLGMYSQKGGAWDHNPDSVQRIIGSPMSTNPSSQEYCTVFPTK